MTETTSVFAVALRELLIEHDFATRSGKPNWSAFAKEIEGVSYETLRRVVAAALPPSRELIEECARALRIRPEYFLEYRLYRAQRDFDPREVGIDRAVENLRVWERAREGRACASE
jgi:hypothetical protein